jgi:ATP-dependent exoDNAse (exonuclease V) alpha subunit
MKEKDVKIEISQKFQDIIDLIENNPVSAFITGKAGTGKSTLLNIIRSKTKKKHAVLSPTGIAAINVGGETIHSFFKFKPNISMEQAQKSARTLKNKKLYLALEMIIIDEISMVRADLFDCMDVFLRTVRKSDLPFGGVQMILIGDIFQLPPVVTQDEASNLMEQYETPYFFSAHSFRTLQGYLEFIELETVFRQTDTHFIRILNAIREGTVEESDLNFLNETCLNNNFSSEGLIYLASTNSLADNLNARYLANLPGGTKKIKGKATGSFEGRALPTDLELNLKNGARVIFLNNEPNKKWVNGSLGTVKEILETPNKEIKVIVKLDTGREVEVEKFAWSNMRSEYDHNTGEIKQEETGKFEQLPLRLAWAITIHKSQGQTFEKVMIDLGRGAFAFGQTYVALSRCKTLEGIILKQPLKPKDIMVDPSIVEFYKRVRRG